MDLLRRPVARATCAAVLEDLDGRHATTIADQVLALDRCAGAGDLEPAQSRPLEPRASRRAPRTPRARRHPGRRCCPPSGSRETACGGRRPCSPPGSRCRSPRAPGCWSSWPPIPTRARARPRRVGDLAPRPADLGDGPRHHDRRRDRPASTLPAGEVVLVSPLLLGRLAELVPGDPDELRRLRPRPVAPRRCPAGRLASVRRRRPRLPRPHPRLRAPARSGRLGSRASAGTGVIRSHIDQSRGILPLTRPHHRLSPTR